MSRGTEEHQIILPFVDEGEVSGFEWFGSESEGSDSSSTAQQHEQSSDEFIRKDQTQDARCGYGKQLCCYYLQGRCHFSGRDCWFSHDVQPFHKPWYSRSCQFGEDCLRGHWVAFLASTLSLASVGASEKVFSQPMLRKRICEFLKPRILPVSEAAGVKWQASEIEGPLDSPATAERDAFEAALMDYLEKPACHLSCLRMRAMAEQRSKISQCVQRVLRRRWIFSDLFPDSYSDAQEVDDVQLVRMLSEQKRFVTVADVKTLIVEQVQEGVDSGEGLHLDGTIDALEDDVRSLLDRGLIGPQDHVTKSRWRQWIIDESIRQDCVVVV